MTIAAYAAGLTAAPPVEEQEYIFRLDGPVEPDIDLICPKCRSMGCPDGPHLFRRYVSASGELAAVVCKGCRAEIRVASRARSMFGLITRMTN